MTTPPTPNPPTPNDTNSSTDQATGDTDHRAATGVGMVEHVYAVGHGSRAKCGGKRKQGEGAPCTRPAGSGTPHPGFGFCKFHGGSTAAHVAGAEKEMARVALEKEVAGFLLVNPKASPVTDPLAEIARLAGTVRSVVDILHSRVNELSVLTGTTDSGSEQVRALVGLWERMIKQSHSLLSDMARLGIEERSVRLEEERLEVVASVLASVAAALLERVVGAVPVEAVAGLRASWPVFVGEIVPSKLRELAGGA